MIGILSLLSTVGGLLGKLLNFFQIKQARQDGANEQALDSIQAEVAKVSDASSAANRERERVISVLTGNVEQDPDNERSTIGAPKKSAHMRAVAFVAASKVPGKGGSTRGGGPDKLPRHRKDSRKAAKSQRGTKGSKRGS